MPITYCSRMFCSTCILYREYFFERAKRKCVKWMRMRNCSKTKKKMQTAFYRKFYFGIKKVPINVGTFSLKVGPIGLEPMTP